MNFKSITAANYAAIAVSIITIGLISSSPPGDGDLWWQMLYGKYMIENLTLIPDHSVFSWTVAENTVFYCAWIAEILLYSIHSIAGLPGLYGFRYLAALLPMVLLLWVGKKNRSATPTVIWLGFLVCYLASFGYGGALKPEMLSFLLFALTVAIYFKLKTEPKNWKLCYLFPAVMLVWVNTHGGFFVGMTFLGVAVVGELVNYLFRSQAAWPRKLLKHLAISAGLTLVALCCNPYGIHYPIQVVTNILEMNDQHFANIVAYKDIFHAEVRHFFLRLYLCIALC
jgi:hypothetical protein